jgi:hypothetical protein
MIQQFKLKINRIIQNKKKINLKRYISSQGKI